MTIHNLTKTQQRLLLKIFQNNEKRYVIIGQSNQEALKILLQLDLIEEIDEDTYKTTDKGNEHLLSYNFIDETDNITPFGEEFIKNNKTFKDYLDVNKSTG